MAGGFFITSANWTQEPQLRKPVYLEPVLLHREKPPQQNEEQLMLPATRGKPAGSGEDPKIKQKVI